MAWRFLSFASILNNERVSAFFRSRQLAISLAETGSLLICRKRNMLSGLRCEGRGMGYRARAQVLFFHRDFSHFFRLFRNFFQDFGIYRQANTRPASRPPSDWPVPREGKRREAG